MCVYVCVHCSDISVVDMTRRQVVMAERIFLQEAGVVTEMQCDLGQ